MERGEDVGYEKSLNNIASDDLRELAAALPAPLYIVGGRVRDALCGLASGDDVDVCGPISADEFSKRARASGWSVTAVYPATGTVKIEKGGAYCEFAAFRTDEYARGHRPRETRFTKDIRTDARRRDFKCDAVYFDISAGELVDPLGGAEDIERRTVSATRAAGEVFSEDGLRLMRLARICAATGFSPDAECLEAARANADLIGDIAPERIWAELEKILAAPGSEGLEILRDTGVLDIILCGDGGKESDLSLCRGCRGDARMAALILDEKGADISADLVDVEAERLSREAERICARLKVAKVLSSKTARLVRMLSGPEGEDIFFFTDNAGLMDDYLALLRAGKNPNTESYGERMFKMRSSGRPVRLKELAVKGEDMAALGYSGAQIGMALRFLLGEAASGRAENSKEALLRLVDGKIL